MTVAVRQAGPADIGEMGGVLGRAFFDDPVWAWMLPDEESRTRRLAAVFELLTRRVHLPHGACDVAGPDQAIKAAAMWDPPGRWRVPVRAQITEAAPMLRAFGTRIPAALRALTTVERHHPAEPHWFLAVIGTDPAAQGGGLGGALLRPRLEHCDATGLPAYLESSNSANIPFYERHGFKITKELALPGRGCPPVWLMWRDPQR